MKQRHWTASVAPSDSPPRGPRPLATGPLLSRFKVPLGWGIEMVPRSDGSRSDTYYYEPDTGRKFRSTKEVERYLNRDEYTPRRSPRKMARHNHSPELAMISYERKNSARKMIVSGGKMLSLVDDELIESHWAIVASTKASPNSPFILPDGWIVEEVPRKFQDHCIDRYYYEPGTGKKFRSMVSVERYLTEMEENTPLSKLLEGIKENKLISKDFKLQFHNSTPVKQNIDGKDIQGPSFVGPPMEVSWVLASPQGDAWNPFVSGTLVPDFLKLHWTDRFNAIMNDGVGNTSGSHAQCEMVI